MTHQEYRERLDEIYLRCDVSNNMTDDPLSQDEFKAEIKQLFLSIVGDDYVFQRPKESYLPNVYIHLKAKNELRQQLRTTITGKEGGGE